MELNLKHVFFELVNTYDKLNTVFHENEQQKKTIIKLSKEKEDLAKQITIIRK